MPGLLLRIDAVNLFLFGHLHIGFMALSEVVYLHTHTYTKTQSNIPKELYLVYNSKTCGNILFSCF